MKRFVYIPGSPVAETKIKAGDVIVAIDEASVLGKTSREVRNALRGLENKPVVLTYVSEGDTLIETVRRVKLTLKSLNDVAEAEQPEKKLLAVLDDGKIVESSETPVSGNLEGVYIDDVSVSSVECDRGRVESNVAKLVSFNRNVIRVNLEVAGAFTVSVIDSNGRYAISVEQNGVVSGVNVLLR